MLGRVRNLGKCSAVDWICMSRLPLRVSGTERLRRIRVGMPKLPPDVENPGCG